jgi:hypothetical protein
MAPICDTSDDITIPLKNGRFRLNPFILQPVGVAGFSIDEFSLTISIDSQINGRLHLGAKKNGA